MTNPDLKRLTVQVTAQQKQLLQQRSQLKHIPISVIIRQILNEHFALS